MKKLSLFIALTILFGLNISYADDSENTTEFKVEIQKMNTEAREAIGENRDEIKENKEEFRVENSDEYKALVAQLSESEQEELEVLRTTFQEASQAFKEEMKSAETDEEKEEIREEIQELSTAHMENMTALLWEDAAELFEARTEVYEENKELREENKQTRAELKESRKEYIATYKTAFVDRIGDRLDNIPAANLETALEKINAKIDKVEDNENMSDTAKETLMDALFALIEIVELKLEWIDGE